MLTVLLGIDHALFREGLAAQLLADPLIGRVIEAQSGPEAVQLFAVHRSAIVLLETDLGGSGAFEAARDIRRIDPKARIIFLSGRPYDSEIEEALELGAQGFLLKRDGTGALLEAVRRISEGRSCYSEPVRRRLTTAGGRVRLCRAGSPALATLTPRERMLLSYLGRGASLKQAAAALGITYKTADNHKARIMQKLDIHDRVELARFAIREGLISPLSPPPRVPIGPAGQAASDSPASR